MPGPPPPPAVQGDDRDLGPPPWTCGAHRSTGERAAQVALGESPATGFLKPSATGGGGLQTPALEGGPENLEIRKFYLFVFPFAMVHCASSKTPSLTELHWAGYCVWLCALHLMLFLSPLYISIFWGFYIWGGFYIWEVLYLGQVQHLGRFYIWGVYLDDFKKSVDCGTWWGRQCTASRIPSPSVSLFSS